MATLAFSSRPGKTEAKKAYVFGFALTEGELRRIHEVLIQQIKRTSVGDDFENHYEVKYRNGSVTYPVSLDEVLGQENSGSAGIVRLSIEVSSKARVQPSTFIGVQFCNTDEDKDGRFSPLSYVVSGVDRDWVFVTSSQLDERLGKIKLLRPSSFFFPMSESLALMLAMLVGLCTFVFILHNEHKQEIIQLNSIEHDWKAGTIKDPVEVVIQLGKISAARADFDPNHLIWPFMFLLGGLCLFSASAICLKYFHPPYNFVWGDYIKVYEGRQAARNFVYVALVVGLLVTIIGGIITKKIGF